jgi:hypothetical protein
LSPYRPTITDVALEVESTYTVSEATDPVAVAVAWKDSALPALFESTFAPTVWVPSPIVPDAWAAGADKKNEVIRASVATDTETAALTPHRRVMRALKRRLLFTMGTTFSSYTNP